MTIKAKKSDPPPYCSYKTFESFINGLRGTNVPSRIDKTLLDRMSGSSQAALMGALKWLGLIDTDSVPTTALHRLVEADDASQSATLADILRSRYGFLSDGSIALSNATAGQVEQKFRDYGISGSTVVKSVSFFISAAKSAGIELGPHVKTPKTIGTNSVRRSRKAVPQPLQAQRDAEDPDDVDAVPDRMAGFVKIPIPLHGMPDGVVFLPDGLTTQQWNYALKITKFLIENYRVDDTAGGGAQ